MHRIIFKQFLSLVLNGVDSQKKINNNNNNANILVFSIFKIKTNLQNEEHFHFCNKLN